MRVLLWAVAGLAVVAGGRGDSAAVTADALLARAQAHLGAPLPPALRVLYLGSGDATAIYQGQDWREPEPRRHQSTLILDFAGRRAALRTEQTRSDGTVSIFRSRVVADAGTNVNVISGLAFPMSADSARQTWTELAWQVPHYALQQLAAQADRLVPTGSRREGGRELVTALFSPAAAPSFTVIFDAASGALLGYEHTQPWLFGPVVHRFLFKEYREVPGLGRYPTGHVQSVGERTWRDVQVFDVRASADLGEHPWLAQDPAQRREASTSRPAETSLVDVAPGVRLLKRIGSYNVLVADLGRRGEGEGHVGDCVAIVDAPARFASPSAVPAGPAPEDLGERIVAIVREKLGRSVCYVVPTHHHADHSGAVRALARAGATVLTAPGDVELMRRIAGPGAKVEAVTDVRTLGPVQIHRLAGGPHVGEMLFAYVPASRAAFDGDALDYLLQSRALVRYLEQRGLVVDTFYSVHSSGVSDLDGVLAEESWN